MAINMISADYDEFHREGSSHPLRQGDIANAVDDMICATEEEHEMDDSCVYHWSPRQLRLAINVQSSRSGKLSELISNRTYEQLFEGWGFSCDYGQHGPNY